MSRLVLRSGYLLFIGDLNFEWELAVVIVEDSKCPESFGTDRLPVAKHRNLRGKKNGYQKPGYREVYFHARP